MKVNIENIYCDRVSANYNNIKLGKFDVITMSNFLTLNEGENQKYAPAIVDAFKKHLENDGSLMLM